VNLTLSDTDGRNIEHFPFTVYQMQLAVYRDEHTATLSLFSVQEAKQRHKNIFL
jgi:hypothetical protein